MLHFYYGVMGSSKTAQLLMQRYNLQQLGLKVAVLKPAIDTRAEHDIVYSRVGLQPRRKLCCSPTTPLKSSSIGLPFNGRITIFSSSWSMKPSFFRLNRYRNWRI